MVTNGHENINAARQPFPLKNAGRLPCFYAARRSSDLLHQKGENRDLPLWNPPSRYVQRESLLLSQPFPLKNAGMASLFLCCAKAKLLLAPKVGEPRSPPLESPIAKCSAGIAAFWPKQSRTSSKIILLYFQMVPLCDILMISNRGIKHDSSSFQFARHRLQRDDDTKAPS